MNRYFTLFLILFCALIVGVKFLRQSDATSQPTTANAGSQTQESPADADDLLEVDDLALSDKTHAAGKAAWERYATAKQDWQQAQHDLLVAADPALAEAAETNLHWQLLLIEFRALKLQHLFEHAPEQVDLKQGLRGLVNFEWTEQQNTELTAREPRFRELAVQIDAIRQSPLQKAEIKRARNAIKEQLSARDAYLTAADDYRAACAEVEQMLQQALSRFVQTPIVPAVPVRQLLPGSEGMLVGLAVRGARGVTYCTDFKDGQALVLDMAGKGPPVSVWSIASEEERLEVAGIDGGKLLLVFNNHAPFDKAEQAWTPGRTYYELNLAFPGLGLAPVHLSPAVCEAVAAKCQQPREWPTSQ